MPEGSIWPLESNNVNVDHSKRYEIKSNEELGISSAESSKSRRIAGLAVVIGSDIGCKVDTIAVQAERL